jgi:DNA-binding transcriptional LysR family regulator
MTPRAARRHHARPVDAHRRRAHPVVEATHDQVELGTAETATFLAHGLPAPSPRVETNSLTVTQAILRSSDCIGVISGSAGQHAQADGLLRTLPLELAGHELPVGAVWRESRPSPAVARVLDVLRSESRPGASRR